MDKNNVIDQYKKHKELNSPLAYQLLKKFLEKEFSDKIVIIPPRSAKQLINFDTLIKAYKRKEGGNKNV